MRRRDRVLVIVGNLPVPLDRRVWMECLALRGAGYGVSVICPKGPGDPRHEVLEGVHLHKYRPAPQASGFLGYVVEFGYSWLVAAVLAAWIYVREGFGAIQACNPPDTYALLAAPYKLLRVRFVYDQHDLNPELFLSRFGPPTSRVGRAQLRMLYALESFTYRHADHVISTNESYRSVAMTRGRKAAADVTVVRSGPDTRRMRPVEPRPELRRGHRYLCVYLGVMGPQDGVDAVIRLAHDVVQQRGRSDIGFALLGFGDCYGELRSLTTELGLDEHVEFTGRADGRMIAEYLSTADVGISPDRLNPLNDLSTMNKVMEYMAYATPVLSFDLKESRHTLGGCGVVVPWQDDVGLTDELVRLLDDEERRVRLGVASRRRCAAVLDWARQRDRYVRVYDALLRGSGASTVDVPAQRTERRGADAWTRLDEWGHRLVDLRSPGVLDESIRGRAGAADGVREGAGARTTA